MSGHQHYWWLAGSYDFGNRTFLEVDSIVVSWWIVFIFAQCISSLGKLLRLSSELSVLMSTVKEKAYVEHLSCLSLLLLLDNKIYFNQCNDVNLEV